MSARQPKWVISGGIGSGKSLVRDVLRRHGYRTVDADSIGHEILEPDGPAFQEVSNIWPDVVAGGQIDRSALGRVVFDDRAELSKLESITHPLIFGRIRSDLGDFDGPIAVEIPLLKHGLDGDEWKRVVVDCNDAVRLERTVARGLTESEARSRMASQPSRERWLAAADIVIPNNQSRDDLADSISRLLARYLS